MGALPTDPTARKNAPLARGLLDYFPRACAAVAELSRVGNEQHNPGAPMHWAREKSTDHADCIVRHIIERGTVDTDGQRHSAKIAWRGLALLETELEEAAFAAHMDSPAEYLEAIAALRSGVVDGTRCPHGMSRHGMACDRCNPVVEAPPGWSPGMETEELGGGSRIELPTDRAVANSLSKLPHALPDLDEEGPSDDEWQYQVRRKVSSAMDTDERRRWDVLFKA